MENLILQQDVIDFLRESNNIEDVWDDLSLAQAITAWNYVIEKPILDASVVLKTHKILMLAQHLLPSEKGYFRKEAVYVGGREGKPWFVIPELIGQWARKVNHLVTAVETVTLDDDHVDLEDLIAQHHVEYEKIHPFIDGNGRTGRIFYNWQRVKCGLPIEVIWECKKEEYYDWFK